MRWLGSAISKVIASACFAGTFALGASLSARASAEEGLAPEPSPDRAPVQPEQVPERAELDRDPAAAGLMLFDLLEQAELAEKQGDARAAARHYEGVARMVPERATAFSKLCALYRALGERELAIQACYRATGLPGTKVADQLLYAELLLHKPAGEEFSDADIRELRSTFQHLRSAGVQSTELEVLICQFAVVLEELDAMRACVERLRSTQPLQSPVTLTYEMSLALFERDFVRGRALLAQARQSGMPSEGIALMERELEARDGAARDAGTCGSVSTASATSSAAVLGGAGLLGVAALLGMRAWRRRPSRAA